MLFPFFSGNPARTLRSFTFALLTIFMAAGSQASAQCQERENIRQTKRDEYLEKLYEYSISEYRMEFIRNLRKKYNDKDLFDEEFMKVEGRSASLKLDLEGAENDYENAKSAYAHEACPNDP